MFKNLIWIFVLAFTTTALSAQTADGKNYYKILVSFSERKLFLLRDGTTIASYPVAVPRSNFYRLPAKGELVRIEINPFWYPTERTRAAYFKTNQRELPRVISPGDPRNAMGAVKLSIGLGPIKIHGTNNPSSIGRRATRGCIRLHNEDILRLVNLIKGKRVEVVLQN